MAIATKDIKLLWGKAAGRCSAPGCSEDLLALLAKSGDVILGEMAHVIGKRPGSARSDNTIATVDGYDNLILLCPNHHTLVDKAAADYPPDVLQKWKSDWEAAVRHRFVKYASVQYASIVSMRTWSYFNFDRILDIYNQLGTNAIVLDRISDLAAQGLITDKGFPLEGPEDSGAARTVFTSWPQYLAHALHSFYSDMIEHIIRSIPVLDMDDAWGYRKLQYLLYPGALVCLNRRCNFRRLGDGAPKEVRSVRCAASQVEVSFQFDTWNVFSNSSLTLHFRGISRIMALLVVRSAEPERTARGGLLHIKATPIAMGTGFLPRQDRTPAIADRCDSTDDDDF